MRAMYYDATLSVSLTSLSLTLSLPWAPHLIMSFIFVPVYAHRECIIPWCIRWQFFSCFILSLFPRLNVTYMKGKSAWFCGKFHAWLARLACNFNFLLCCFEKDVDDAKQINIHGLFSKTYNIRILDKLDTIYIKASWRSLKVIRLWGFFGWILGSHLNKIVGTIYEQWVEFLFLLQGC